jgi:hypothetical protein
MGGFLRWRKRRLRARSRASAIPTLCQLDPSVPDPEWGESVASVIVLREECAGVDADTLIAFCRDHLGSFKKPKRMSLSPSFRYSQVLRRDLRDRFNWRH